MSRFGRHLKNRMLGFPAQILPMMGFSSCDNSDVFQWLKLVSIGRSCSEPFSHLQHACERAYCEVPRVPGMGVLLQLVPPEAERPLGASRLGLSHWAGPSVTGSAGWSQSWYRGIIVDILAKESKFP